MNHYIFRWGKIRTAASLFSIGALIIGFSSLAGWIFAERGQEFLEQELQSRLHAVATIAAVTLSREDISQIHTAEDYKKPAYARLVQQLIKMREENPDILFAYILRPTNDPDTFAFVADADSLDPYAPIDSDNNGTIDASEELSPPGQVYDISEIPELHQALSTPTNTTKPYSDQWGTYMSGFAPIVDSNNQIIAVVGFDMDSVRYTTLSQRILSPPLLALRLLISTFLGIFVVFMFWKRHLEASRSLSQERAKLLMLTFHQLGTPLTLVRWATANLQELQQSFSNTNTTESFTKNISTLHEAVDRFDGILKLLKQANQVETGNMKYQAQKNDLINVITDSIVQLQLLVEERRQIIEVDAPSSLMCNFDPVQISVVVIELLTNASHFSPAKSTIKITAHKEHNAIHVTVQDNGPGVSASDLDHVFEEFSRGKKATTQHPNGYGLGLFISHGIIDSAGGTIWADSKIGKGTAIHFTLPQPKP